MKILKLPWLSHRAENKTLECYALDINSAGSKLASGGLDGKVKVWDLAQILQHADSSDTPGPAPERRAPLASMNRHNGVVTCVKFSPDGRFLASGSDDKIVLIWEKDEELAPRPKQFGETEPDAEHWTVRRRLVAHDNDVQDICWAPDALLLITVGLDRSIIIWHGATFERIKRYDLHQSMVKGVVFDPANKFFATASDDRSVRIFRYYKKPHGASAATHEFQMEQVVVDAFRKSPLTLYFRRMLWLPDGQHLAVPNATNGPVSSVVVINRGTWATDVSLIGHEAPCEVCAFAPVLFCVPGGDTHTTILATGGQDRTLAVWSTGLSKPLVVAHDIAQKPITDMAWTPDGQALFVSSLDGLITCVRFAPAELGEPVGADAIGLLLERYGGDDATVMPEGVDLLRLEGLARGRLLASGDNASTADLARLRVPPPRLGGATPRIDAGAAPAPAVVLTKTGRKRVAPTLISTYAGPAGPASHGLGALLPLRATAPLEVAFKISAKLSQTLYVLPKNGLQSAVHGRRLNIDMPAAGPGITDPDNDNEDMGFDAPNSALLQPLTAAAMRLKIKKFRKQRMGHRYPTPFKAVSDLPGILFSNQAIMNADLAKLVQADQVNVADTELVSTSSLDSVDESMYFRVIVAATTHELPGHDDSERPHSSHHSSHTRSIIEIRNGPPWPEDDEVLNTDPVQRTDFQDPTQVIVTCSDRAQLRSYALYFPFKIQHAVPVLLDRVLAYYVLISFEGTTQIIRANTGSYFLPCFELGANVVALRQKGRFFMVLTSLGQLFCWKFPALRSGRSRLEKVYSGVSVAPAVNAETFVPSAASQQDADARKDSKTQPAQVLVDNISALEIDEHDGLPIIVMQRTSCVYLYSVALMVWTKVLDPWYLLAYEKQELATMTVPTLNRQVFASVADLKLESIQRGEAGSYKFDETNSELKCSMRTRFEELAALSC
ncbi:WD40 repeat-like protein [Metschnikowia bicuspidata var. bicuspidata NRRL YB-4993]|uniref:Protein HIR n=1 Tax=Metschnikowia bicuspidata var. bicuspidata NRRL YB-4993 TaxID=869754 RepID=A0A1A0HIZ4_9ASCO|nr:WD40 repeat-like protein [Metschnikowia bicuspidata var. bicuspidata NRRL YB-4993]OBA24129.1 WD40 repeat-like protein [Metschnikowia bicuspidata var. bicuspidata NRRL YB-4993]